jgi:hypothetical protein
MIFSKRGFLQNDCCSAILGCPCSRTDSRERPTIMFECSVNLWEIEGFFVKVWGLWVGCIEV